jgi:hypothetical protein
LPVHASPGAPVVVQTAEHYYGHARQGRPNAAHGSAFFGRIKGR